MGCGCKSRRGTVIQPISLIIPTSKLLTLLITQKQDLILKIFDYLTLKELGNASMVCNYFNKAAGNKKLLDKYCHQKPPETNPSTIIQNNGILICAQNVFIRESNDNDGMDLHVDQAATIFNINRKSLKSIATSKVSEFLGPFITPRFVSQIPSSIMVRKDLIIPPEFSTTLKSILSYKI